MMQIERILNQRKRKAVSLNIPSHPFSLMCHEGAIIPSLKEIILDAFSRFDENFAVLSKDQRPIALPPQLASKLIQTIANNPNATEVDLNLVLFRILSSTKISDLDLRNTHLLSKVTCLNLFQLCSNQMITTLDISYARGCSSDELLMLCKSFEHLRYLNASNCIPFNDYCLASLLEKCPPLESLNISGCNRITDFGFKYIGNITTLKRVIANGLNSLSIDGLQYLRNLTELEIVSCRKLTDRCLLVVANNNKELTTVALSSQQITDKGLQTFLQQLQNLTYLNLSNCLNASVLTLSQLFHSRYHLLYLNLSNCFGICGEEIMQSYTQMYSSSLFSWLQDLQYLNIAGCSRCSSKFLACLLQNTPNLKTLIFDGINVDFNSLHSFAQASKLTKDITRRSVVRSCDKVNPLTISFKQCNISTQTFCDFFTVRGSDIISLNVSNCPSLNDYSLSILADYSSSLTHFYCSNNTLLPETVLSRFLLKTPKLRVLFLSGNCGVTERVLTAVKDTCRNISHLDISGCTSLTDGASQIIASMKTLQYLDISFTTLDSNSVQIIINNLPRLTTFSMQGISFSENELFSQEAQWMNALRLNFVKCSNGLLQNISDNCPLLSNLELRMCADVTDEGIQMLLSKCTKLLSIVLTGTSVSRQIVGYLASKGVSIL